MSETEFWSIVDQSRSCFRNGLQGSHLQQEEDLRAILEKKTPQEVADFSCLLDQMVARAYRRDLWAAAHLINAGCSDDSFTDFRVWLVSMGREAYENALDDPDSLIGPATDPAVEDVFFESFLSVPFYVLESKNWEETQAPPHPELTGPLWSEKDLATHLPRLWARFGPAFEEVRPPTDRKIVS